MLKKCVFFAGLVTLAGCASTARLPIAQDVQNVTFTSSFAAQDIERGDLMTVRSVQTQGFNWAEFAGASCRLQGRGFETSFQTPAVLRLPVYLKRTDDVRIQCRATFEGRDVVSGKTVEAINLNAPKDEGVTLRTGTSGTSLDAVISLRDRDKDRFDYPKSVNIVFR